MHAAVADRRNRATGDAAAVRVMNERLRRRCSAFRPETTTALDAAVARPDPCAPVRESRRLCPRTCTRSCRRSVASRRRRAVARSVTEATSEPVPAPSPRPHTTVHRRPSAGNQRACCAAVPPSSNARATISGRVIRLPAAPSEPRDSSSVATHHAEAVFAVVRLESAESLRNGQSETPEAASTPR